VSGGPAFHTREQPYLMGVLSAYIANRATGATLPGLSVIQDLSHLHEVIKGFKSYQDAKAQEQAEKEKERATPPPPPAADVKPIDGKAEAT